MHTIIKCATAVVMICIAVAASAIAQEKKPDNVQVKTVIGEKFKVTLKLVSVDIARAKKLGCELVGTEPDPWISVEVTPEFEQIFQCMESVKIVTSLETGVIEARSGVWTGSQLKIGEGIYGLVALPKVTAENEVFAMISFSTIGMFGVTNKTDYHLKTQLGKNVVLKPAEVHPLASSVYWIIARVDEPEQEKAE